MHEKPRWQDLSKSTKIRIVGMGAIQVALLVAALWAIRRRPAAEIRGRKGWWIVASLINFVGPIAYFIFGRRPKAGLPGEELPGEGLPEEVLPEGEFG